MALQPPAWGPKAKLLRMPVRWLPVALTAGGPFMGLLTLRSISVCTVARIASESSPNLRALNDRISRSGSQLPHGSVRALITATGAIDVAVSIDTQIADWIGAVAAVLEIVQIRVGPAIPIASQFEEVAVAEDAQRVGRAIQVAFMIQHQIAPRPFPTKGNAPRVQH